MQRATTSQWDHLRRALSSLTDAPLPDGNEPRPATFVRAGLFCREGDTWALHKRQSFWRLGSQGTSARRVMTMSAALEASAFGASRILGADLTEAAHGELEGYLLDQLNDAADAAHACPVSARGRTTT